MAVWSFRLGFGEGAGALSAGARGVALVLVRRGSRSFQESTKVEPDFTMGYWGEAMAHNHPLWSEQDIAAARQVIAKIKESPNLTERERAYLNAVKLLYGEGDKRARDQLIQQRWRKSIALILTISMRPRSIRLSLLGLVRAEDKSYRLQARAGAIALDVYQKNPNHPGAAHYIIHAFDDPEHAILALPAARRYADIAPEAHHARHMPSHIFLQLGMWPEAAASNLSAWESSDAWMKRKKLSLNVRDYHSLHWLLYAYLQQGRYNQAEQLLNLMKKVMSESTYDNKLRPGYYENNYANMAAAFIVETERWNLATELFPDYRPTSGSSEQSGNERRPWWMPHASAAAEPCALHRPAYVAGLCSRACSGHDRPDEAIDSMEVLGQLRSQQGADSQQLWKSIRWKYLHFSSMKKDHNESD